MISIHALCEEGDLNRMAFDDYLPRFLSTPSARRATYDLTKTGYSEPISIHALCEEGDRMPLVLGRQPRDFYPRPLRGGRLLETVHISGQRNISIHALCEEGDSKNRDKISIFKQIIQHSARI